MFFLKNFKNPCEPPEKILKELEVALTNKT
jgi:hypothetical protein